MARKNPRNPKVPKRKKPPPGAPSVRVAQDRKVEQIADGTIRKRRRTAFQGAAGYTGGRHRSVPSGRPVRGGLPTLGKRR